MSIYREIFKQKNLNVAHSTQLEVFFSISEGQTTQQLPEICIPLGMTLILDFRTQRSSLFISETSRTLKRTAFGE